MTQNLLVLSLFHNSVLWDIYIYFRIHKTSQTLSKYGPAVPVCPCNALAVAPFAIHSFPDPMGFVEGVPILEFESYSLFILFESFQLGPFSYLYTTNYFCFLLFTTGIPPSPQPVCCG